MALKHCSKTGRAVKLGKRKSDSSLPQFLTIYDYYSVNIERTLELGFERLRMVFDSSGM